MKACLLKAFGPAESAPLILKEIATPDPQESKALLDLKSDRLQGAAVLKVR